MMQSLRLAINLVNLPIAVWYGLLFYGSSLGAGPYPTTPILVLLCKLVAVACVVLFVASIISLLKHSITALTLLKASSTLLVLGILDMRLRDIIYLIDSGPNYFWYTVLFVGQFLFWLVWWGLNMAQRRKRAVEPVAAPASTR